MKRALVVVMAIFVAGYVTAEEVSSSIADKVSVSVSLDAASAYVFRGATFNDGFVLQPGAEVSCCGATLGVWANFDIDDYDGALEENEFSEVDLYASYEAALGSVNVSIGYSVYTYEAAGAEDDHELSFGMSTDVFLSPTLDAYLGLDGAIDSSAYVELGISHGCSVTEKLDAELAAAIGYLESDVGDSGFTHADLSASLSCGYGSLSVTYVLQLDDDVLMDVEDGGVYDTEIYAMLSTGIEF